MHSQHTQGPWFIGKRDGGTMGRISIADDAARSTISKALGKDN